MRIHDLRRSLGSWQAMRGASLSIIGKSLGHTQSRTTEIYARLSLDPVRQSVDSATAAMLTAGRRDGQRRRNHDRRAGDGGQRQWQSVRSEPLDRPRFPRNAEGNCRTAGRRSCFFFESLWPFFRVRANLASWQARHLMTASSRRRGHGTWRRRLKWAYGYGRLQGYPGPLAQNIEEPKAKHGHGRFGTSKGSKRQKK